MISSQMVTSLAAWIFRMSGSGYAVTQLLRGTLKPDAGSTETLCRPSGSDSTRIDPLIPWYSAILADIGDPRPRQRRRSARSFPVTVGRIPRSASFESDAGARDTERAEAIAVHADVPRSFR